MRKLLSRDVPRGAALSIVALVLVASVVTGRDAANPATVAVVEPLSASTGTVGATPAAEDIPIDRLRRAKREGEVADLFAPPPPPVSLAAVKAAAPPPPPPPPSAPPLPYRYLGRMVDGDALILFLARGNDALTVRVGETLEGEWRVDAAAETSIRFTYLPLNLSQQLPVPALP
jgi:hypothetical protein